MDKKTEEYITWFLGLFIISVIFNSFYILSNKTIGLIWTGIGLGIIIETYINIRLEEKK